VARLDEAERREAINRSLERVGRASVAGLAREFGVSEVTIRKDLSELERRGVLTRVHGGATRTSLKDEGSFASRLLNAVESKRDIAHRAARLVHSGDTIILDSSSSAHFLAQELLELRDLVVVTYSIPTASLFLDRSAASVYLIGGPLRRSSRATSVSLPVRGAPKSVGLGFFGAHSASVTRGLGEMSAEEAQSKAALAALCPRIYALVDESKFADASFHYWLPPDKVTGVITAEGAPDESIRRWRSVGVTVDTGERVHRSAAG